MLYKNAFLYYIIYDTFNRKDNRVAVKKENSDKEQSTLKDGFPQSSPFLCHCYCTTIYI